MEEKEGFRYDLIAEFRISTKKTDNLAVFRLFKADTACFQRENHKYTQFGRYVTENCQREQFSNLLTNFTLLVRLQVGQ